MSDVSPALRNSPGTLRQMRAFVAVAQDGSITQAAKRLHLTTSALSMLVSSFEGEIGVRLFERTTRRLVLTEAGEELLPAIVKVFDDLDHAYQGLRQFSHRRSGRLTLATSPLLAATLVPALLASFSKSYSAVRVELHDLPVGAIAEAVRSGQVDFGVCTADANVPDLVSTVLYQDRLMLACLPDHPFAVLHEVQWTDLIGERLALLSRGSGLRSLVEQGFAAQNETIEPSFEVAQVTTAVGLVEAGLAVSILPSYALASARSVGVVSVPLVQPVVERNIVALTAPQRKLTLASEAFLTHFKTSMLEMQANVQGASVAPKKRKTAGK
jgi:DNA-binding transcriptional LysR family regulator